MFVLLLAVAVLQTTVAPRLTVMGAAPDAVLVAVLCCALLRGSVDGMLWGLMGGLAMGLLSGAPLGTHAIMLTLTGFLAGLGQPSPFSSRLVVPLLTAMVATLLYTAGMAAILQATGRPTIGSPEIARMIVPVVVANSALMLVVYWVSAALVRGRGAQSQF